MDQSKLQFVLTGFNQETGVRVFSFDGIGADHVRTPFTVTIDLGLAQRYGIRLQELPLLCRTLLDRNHNQAQKAYTYTEADMCDYANAATVREQAAKARKPPRRPLAPQPTTGWRSPSASTFLLKSQVTE